MDESGVAVAEPGVRVKLRIEVFNRACARRGARSDAEVADLLGLAYVTVWRLRNVPDYLVGDKVAKAIVEGLDVKRFRAMFVVEVTP